VKEQGAAYQTKPMRGAMNATSIAIVNLQNNDDRRLTIPEYARDLCGGLAGHTPLEGVVRMSMHTNSPA